MEYYLPTRLITGAGAVTEHAPLLAAFGRRCLIVTSGTAARRCGALDDVTAALNAEGVAWEIYDGILPNPTMASCLEGGRRARDFGAEFIIGIGGGSPLDASKVVAVSAANPELDEDGVYSLRWPKAPLPIVLVGTTAGTGSEVTPISVITDRDGRKRSVKGESMYGSLSLGDPRYTASMPHSVTASTGVDALAHCLESYLNKTATDISRAFALEGIARLVPPLRAVADGLTPTPEQREALYNGSILGGMAISITGTVLPHNLGYYLTENHNLPHGFACAVYLPALLRHAMEADPAYTETMFRRAGVSQEELTRLIRDLLPPLEIRLTAEDVEALLPRWENVPNVQKTLGGVTGDQIRRILTELFVR